MSANPSRAGSRASRAGDARPRDSTGRYTGIGKAGKEQASTPAGDQRQLQIAHGETEQASGGEVVLAQPGGSMVQFGSARPARSTSTPPILQPDFDMMGEDPVTEGSAIDWRRRTVVVEEALGQMTEMFRIEAARQKAVSAQQEEATARLGQEIKGVVDKLPLMWRADIEHAQAESDSLARDASSSARRAIDLATTSANDTFIATARTTDISDRLDKLTDLAKALGPRADECDLVAARAEQKADIAKALPNYQDMLSPHHRVACGLGGGRLESRECIRLDALFRAGDGSYVATHGVFGVVDSPSIPMLVGMDILAPEGAKLDLGRGRLELSRDGETFTVGCSIRRVHASTRLEICAREEVVIPPGQSRLVQADVSRLDPLAMYCLQSVSHGAPGLGVPAVISRDEPTVRVGNQRRVPVTLRAGATLGLARPMPPALAGQNLSWVDNVFEPTYDHPLPPDILPHERTATNFQDVSLNPELDEGQRDILLRLASRHRGLFSDQLGCARMTPEEWMRIPITLDQELKFRTPQPFRSSPRAKNQIDKDFDKNRDQGRMMDCPWSPIACQVFAVWQPKDRSVVDCCPLNDMVPQDAYPAQRLDDCFNMLAGKRFISTTDLTSAFYQLPVHPDDRYKTAVVSHRGLDMFAVAPMGYKNSPQFLQRFMNRTLKGIGDAKAYVDNLVIASDDFEQHVNQLDETFCRLQRAGLTVRGKNTSLGFPAFRLFGREADGERLMNPADRVEAIRQLEVPTTFGQLDHSIGLFGWNRDWVPFYAQWSAPLQSLKTQLLRTEPEANVNKLARRRFGLRTVIRLTELEQRSFETLREALADNTVIYHFRHDRALYLFVDAAREWGIGVGAYQRNRPEPEWSPDDPCPPAVELRAYCFLSRELSPSERGMWATEMEFSGLVWAVKKLRTAIEQVPTVVYTDHQPGAGIARMKSLTTDSPGRSNLRLQAWAVFLSQFWAGENQGAFAPALYVRWKKGADMQVPDTLSRYKALLPAPGEDGHGDAFPGGGDPPLEIAAAAQIEISIDQALLDRVRQGYAADQTLARAKARLTDGGRATPKRYQFLWEDNLLWFRSPEDDLHHRLAVPASAQQPFLEAAHDQAGHPGVERTYATLRDHYYMPTMTRVVKRYIANCPACAVNKVPHHRPTAGPLQPIPTAAIPFHTITMDLITDLPRERGFDTIMTLTDKFTKMIVLLPGRKDFGGKQWAEVYFRQVFPWIGFPTLVISDRDKRFIEGFFAGLMRATGVKSLATSAYHPAADGQSERSNQTLEVSLRFFVDSTQKGWVEALSAVMPHLNNQISASTGFTPAELVFGRVLGTSLATIPPKPDTAVDVAAFMDRRRMWQAEAADALVMAQQMQAEAADKRHWLFSPKAGDWVKLRLRPKTYRLPSVEKQKLGPQFLGPFRVLEVVGRGNAVRLELPAAMKIHPVISVIHLEPARVPGTDPYGRTWRPGPVSIEGGESERFEVERILDERGDGKVLVKWLGYPVADATWEPLAELRMTAPEIVEMWEQRSPTGLM